MIPKTSLFAYNTRKYTYIKGKKKREHVCLNETYYYLQKDDKKENHSYDNAKRSPSRKQVD